MHSFANTIRLVHNWVGRAMIVAGFVQMGLGINILYPFGQGSLGEKPVWIAYFAVVGLWVAVFLAAEVCLCIQGVGYYL